MTGRVIGPECVRSISDVRYGIESNKLTRPRTNIKHLSNRLEEISVVIIILLSSLLL